MAKLKVRMRQMLYQNGKNPELLEEMAFDKDIERQSIKEYEKFITEKTRYRPVELIIDAYEGILDDERVDEKNTLNKKRFTEHEINRPPQDLWYMLKDRGFNKELYRNRVALKPNNYNAVYLSNLQDNNLY